MMMSRAQDNKNAADSLEESTPLLAHSQGGKTTQPDPDEESAPIGYLGAPSAAAPPPAGAPPPPPLLSAKSANEDTSITSAGSPSQDQEQVSSDTSLASQNQLSISLSTKSGKSGKSRRKKRQIDDASTKNGKSKKEKGRKKNGPKKSICHLLFDAVRYMAILASCMMFAMQIVPLVILGHESTWLQIAVRLYLAIFCLSFVVTESRIPFLRKISSPHNNWILRGFFYSFVGLIGMEQDIAVKVEEIATGTKKFKFGTSSVLGPDFGTLFASLFMSLTTWIMISVGVIYTILGLLCMQAWYERLDKEYREKAKEQKNKKKMEKDARKQREEYKKSEKDRQEGGGEWYDDLK